MSGPQQNYLRENIREAIASGADINKYVTSGATFLHQAILTGDVDAVHLLLEAGADPSVPDKINNPPLHLACMHWHPAIVRVLIKKGADVNGRGRWGETPLYWACINKTSEIASILIEAGAKTDAPSADGGTPLHQACEGGCIDNIKFLLDHGADPCLADKYGKIPLDCVLELDQDDPAREWIIDWYREHHPELVMEVYCSRGRRP